MGGSAVSTIVSCLLYRGKHKQRDWLNLDVFFFLLFQTDICLKFIKRYIPDSSLLIHLSANKRPQHKYSQQSLKVSVNEVLTRSCPCRNTPSCTLYAMRESGRAVKCTLTSSSSSAMSTCCMISTSFPVTVRFISASELYSHLGLFVIQLPNR